MEVDPERRTTPLAAQLDVVFGEAHVGSRLLPWPEQHGKPPCTFSTSTYVDVQNKQQNTETYPQVLHDR